MFRLASSISITILLVAGVFRCVSYADDRDIRLIVRADDMGCCHAVNVACIDSYQNGIVRSVEVMVPTPWFNEAVAMINQQPGLDIGIHLTLTSEWELLKWGPITQSPSLVDRMGHFFSHDQPTERFSAQHRIFAVQLQT